MKLTGLILVLVGLAAGAICTVVLVQPTHPGADAGMLNPDQIRGPNMLAPLAICGAAVVIGVLMMLFGGRGYWITNDPRMRN